MSIQFNNLSEEEKEEVTNNLYKELEKTRTETTFEEINDLFISDEKYGKILTWNTWQRYLKKSNIIIT